MSQPHRPTTPQEIFNTVAMHLFTQGRRAVNGFNGNMCSYRAPNGDRCALGILIPDEYYSVGMEGVTVNGILHLLPKQLQPHDKLLIALQNVHDFCIHRDNVFVRSQLKHELEAVALSHNLSTEILFAFA